MLTNIRIWAKPNVKGLSPSYKTRKFTDDMKRDNLVRIIESTDRHSGEDSETAPIPAHSDVSMSASILSPGKSVTHELVKEGDRNVYLHVVMTGKTQPKSGGARIKVGDVELGEGDGAYVTGAKGPGSVTIESVGEREAEFLLFDLGTK
jgi:redox-sensitive bicupin YhaK (pirin superfamily)